MNPLSQNKQMNASGIVDFIKETYADAVLSTDYPYGLATIEVKPEFVAEIIASLKNLETTPFSFLTDLCGVHYPDREAPLGVVYTLHNLKDNVRIRIKTFLPLEKPEVPSITSLFSAANWMERETYDFYGIIFTGHPDLRRILNVEYMDYFPMRKEYPLEDATRDDKDDRFFGR